MVYLRFKFFILLVGCLFIQCFNIVFDNPLDSDGIFKGKPIIRLLGPDTVICAVNEHYVDMGYVVKDDKDSEEDLLKNLNITFFDKDSTPVNALTFTKTEGIYVVHFVVIDSDAKESAPAKRVIVVSKDSPPYILLLGPQPYIMNVADNYIEPRCRALSNSEGNLSDKVTIENKVDNTLVGKNSVVYKVKDSKGRIRTMARTVQVRAIGTTDKMKPVISLRGSQNEKVKVGDQYVDPGVLEAKDNEDGIITNNVKAYDDHIDTSVKGEHTIFYVLSDKAGNYTTVTRKVIVE